MQLKEVKEFKNNEEFCNDYYVYQDLVTLKLFLFRKIPKAELHWYLFGQSKKYDIDLMAVRLNEVSDLVQAEMLVNMMWNASKVFFREENRR